ncbi:MAG: hypothetical protein EHM28_12895, partial [Spirochaetaceae bacterium]
MEQLLDAKRSSLDEVNLKKLRDSFQAFQIYFENVFNILIRKGLIQEDPYKYDEKISEVSTPSDDGVLDSEETDKMSQRLSSFHSHLEFLNNYYEFSVDFLNLSRIKRIVKFVKYINWSQVTETAVSVSTRALAKYFGKVRHGSDPLSASIINDSIGQIEKTLKISISLLGELAAFQKERYKLDLRQRIFTRLNLSGQIGEDKIDDITRRAKQLFPEAMGNTTAFFPELVKEVIMEDYSSGGADLKRQVLESLKIEEK